MQTSTQRGLGVALADNDVHLVKLVVVIQLYCTFRAVFRAEFHSFFGLCEIGEVGCPVEATCGSAPTFQQPICLLMLVYTVSSVMETRTLPAAQFSSQRPASLKLIQINSVHSCGQSI